MKGNIPINLYKYRSLSGDFGRATVEQIISKNRIYWQSPLQFNDPFDCLPVLKFPFNIKERKRFSAKAAVQGNSAKGRRARRGVMRDINKVHRKEMEDILKASWAHWLEDTAVTCFSEVGDEPLMWGHYADSHKGVCFKFHEYAGDKLQWFAMPVAYYEERPIVKLTSFSDEENAMKALFSKANWWEYEREHRMIDWRGKPGLRSFPHYALKEVILGAKISSEDEAFVRSLSAGRPGLSVTKAKIHPTQYRLVIDQT